MLHLRISLLILSVCLSCIESYWWWGNREPWEAKDNVGLENKYKMRNMTHELLMTATLKIRHILDIRDYHSDSISYQTGFIMGKVREKYRRMMEHYYQWRDKASGKSALAGPGVKRIRPLHFLLTMEHIFTYEADIHKYCDTLVKFFTNDKYPVEGGARINRAILKNAKAQVKAIADNQTSTNAPSKRRMEEQLKSS